MAQRSRNGGERKFRGRRKRSTREESVFRLFSITSLAGERPLAARQTKGIRTKKNNLSHSWAMAAASLGRQLACILSASEAKACLQVGNLNLLRFVFEFPLLFWEYLRKGRCTETTGVDTRLEFRASVRNLLLRARPPPSDFGKAPKMHRYALGQAELPSF
jgi:hypothetical protein